MNTRLPIFVFLPQSVWNGGNIAKVSSISLAVSFDINVHTSSGVWYEPFSSAVILSASCENTWNAR